MDKLRVTKATLSKNNVSTKETITIQVFAKTITQEPINERLAFVLGSVKPKT